MGGFRSFATQRTNDCNGQDKGRSFPNNSPNLLHHPERRLLPQPSFRLIERLTQCCCQYASLFYMLRDIG